MQLYYITDRRAFPGDEVARRRRLLDKMIEAARAGVDCIQIREKDLTAAELEAFGREAVCAVRQANPETRILLNSRMDVALAIEADGIHLRGDDISPGEVAAIRSGAENSGQRIAAPFLTAVSCHSTDDVRQAELEGASFAVLAPIFGKQTSFSVPAPVPALGLEALRAACRGKLPVLALGGVTLENAEACLEAGATGIAAIRLFQNHSIGEVAGRLRSL
jgi:thiamine-phosphate pyrophosphorylase